MGYYYNARNHLTASYDHKVSTPHGVFFSCNCLKICFHITKPKWMLLHMEGP